MAKIVSFWSLVLMVVKKLWFGNKFVNRDVLTHDIAMARKGICTLSPFNFLNTN